MAPRAAQQQDKSSGRNKAVIAAASTPPDELAFTFKHTGGPVHCVVYNSGASYCLSGGQDRLVKLWNPNTGLEVKTYSAHGYEVLGITVSPDNSKFASCGGDRPVFFWDVATGKTIKRFSGHLTKVNAVSMNFEGTVLGSAGNDGTVRLWDLRSQQGMPIQVLQDAKDSITSLVIRNELIFSGSVDGSVRTYDLRMGEQRMDLIDQPVTSITPLQDNSAYLVSSLDSTIRLMDVSRGTLLQSFTGHRNKDYRSKATFGYGEGSVLAGDEDGKLWCWDVQDGSPIYSPKIHDKVITWVEHHPTSPNQMLTASADGTIKVWTKSAG